MLSGPGGHLAEEDALKTLLVAFAVVCCGHAHAETAYPDLERARNIAANCTSCHGPRGVSQGGIPSLAGQAKSELLRKMQDYKAGRVPSTIMTQLAKGYTDAQIDLAADWFAMQKP